MEVKCFRIYSLQNLFVLEAIVEFTITLRGGWGVNHYNDNFYLFIPVKQHKISIS